MHRHWRVWLVGTLLLGATGCRLAAQVPAAGATAPGYWPVDDPRSGGMRDVMLLYVGDKG
jgi:hypothetical protein